MMTLPNRPQSYGEIFATAFQIMKQTFPKTFSLFLLLMIASYVLQPLGSWIDISNKENEIGMVLVGGLIFLVLLFLSYAFFGAAVFRTHHLVKKTDPGFAESLGFGSKKVIPLIIVSILYSLAILFGLVLLIIPGIMVLIYLIFSIYLIYLDFSILDALKESYRLVKQHWWRTAINLTLLTLAIFAFVLIYVGLLILISVGLTALLAAMLSPEYYAAYGEEILVTILTVITLFAMIPIYSFGISFMLSCIYDLRTRHSPVN